MQVNIDEIISKLTDWDLSLTVAGKTFTVAPPSVAVKALFQKIATGAVVAGDVVPQIRTALASLITDADDEIKTWDPTTLLVTVGAIITHDAQALRKNSSGIVAAVQAAMQPKPAPQTPAAPIKLATETAAAPASQSKNPTPPPTSGSAAASAPKAPGASTQV